jgi:hypothetical protein
MSRRAYPSDLTDTQWAILEPLIPPPADDAPNLTYERREIVNGILYVLRSGCPTICQPEAPSTGTFVDGDVKASGIRSLRPFVGRFAPNKAEILSRSRGYY